MNAPKIRVEFEFESNADGMDKAVALLRFADQQVPEPAPPTTPAPAPKKGKTAAAPAPAPKGKPPAAASKANSKGHKEPEPDIMDLNMGGDEDEEEDGGLGLADDDQEEAEFDGTPEEAKEEALAILRTMLGNGLKSHVKEVQQIMKVAKFHDVPGEQGFEFLAAVKKVEAKIARN